MQFFQASSSDTSEDGVKYELIDDNGYRVKGFVNPDDSRESPVIPEKVNGIPVTEIERFAFEGSTSLKNISIPESVSDIDVGAFKDCTAVESIKISYVSNRGSGWSFGYHFGDNANVENADVVPASLKSV